MSDVIGVIGLGVMGSAMSSHVIRAGHEVHGFDTDPDKLSAFGGVSAASVAEVVEVPGWIAMGLHFSIAFIFKNSLKKSSASVMPCAR